MTTKNPQKQGRILEGGGENFSGWPEYIPLRHGLDSLCNLNSPVGLEMLSTPGRKLCENAWQAARIVVWPALWAERMSPLLFKYRCDPVFPGRSKFPVEGKCIDYAWLVLEPASFPLQTTLRSVGWSVGRSVIISEKGGKLHFHAPIGALVFLWIMLFFISCFHEY